MLRSKICSVSLNPSVEERGEAMGHQDSRHEASFIQQALRCLAAVLEPLHSHLVALPLPKHHISKLTLAYGGRVKQLQNHNTPHIRHKDQGNTISVLY